MTDPALTLGTWIIALVALLIIVLGAYLAFWAVVDWRDRRADYDNTDDGKPNTDPPSDGITEPSAPSVRPSEGGGRRIRPGNRNDLLDALIADGWSLEQVRRELKGANDKIGSEYAVAKQRRATGERNAVRIIEARRQDGTTHEIELGGAA